MTRGKFFWFLGNCPNVALLKVVSGPGRIGVFVTLNTSQRKYSLYRSVKGNIFPRAMFSCGSEGSRMSGKRSGIVRTVNEGKFE